MKKTKAYVTVVLLAACMPATAQVWSGSSISTTTTGDCSVGGKLLLPGAIINMSVPSDNKWRVIQGVSDTMGLALYSKNKLANGSTIELFAASNSAAPGAIHYTSHGGDDSGHVFQYYDTSVAGLHTSASISKDGSIFGMDAHLSDIIPGDIVTVKDIMGFFSSADANERSIHGNTDAGLLSILSNNNTTTGSGIELFGASYVTTPDSRGAIHYTSAGTQSHGHVFYNYNGTYHNNVIIDNDGRTMVGHDIDPSLTSSADILTVKDQIGFYQPSTANKIINGNSPTTALAIQENTGQYDGPTIVMYGESIPSPDNFKSGRIYYTAFGNTDYGHLFCNQPGATGSLQMSLGVKNDGKVVIGHNLINSITTSTPTPGNYLLYVEKGILTEKLRVANSTDGANWADFVFSKDYKLTPLCDVAAYIKANKHLPEIPTAGDVARDGIDVTGMDAKLLQKIEELTLYVIQQQKEIDDLKKQISH